MKKITRDMVTLTLTADAEDDNPEGHFASGDDEQDRKDCEAIRKDLDSGNDWAWCCAHLRGEFNGLRADAYLGGCNYDSREQFMEPGGYYDDMVAEVLADLNAQAATLSKALA